MSGASSFRRSSLSQRAADYFGLASRTEFVVVAALIGLLVALKIWSIIRFRFDSDESAHAHVIWGWARGFVQYRDIFSNHMPLFQIMFAPIFGLIGDRPTILCWLRFILLPMYFVAAWCTYRIGALLFSRRAGLWAVIFAGFFGSYYFISLEFRTDNLWAPLWLLCVVVLLRGALSVPRALVAGLLLGLCFAVSLKSTLFLLSIFLAAFLALLLVGFGRLGLSWIHLARCIAAFLATTLIVPASVVAFFWFKGIWQDFRYCVFDFNLLAARVYEHRILYKSLPGLASIIVFLGLVLVVCLMRKRARALEDSNLLFKRGFIFFVCAAYILAIKSGLWLLSSRDDYPPFYPLVSVLFSGALLTLSERLFQRDWKVLPIFRFAPLTVLVALVEIFLLTRSRLFWKEGTRRETNLLRDVLALTEPADFVLDGKGETIFRQRCFRPVLETITTKAIRRGIITDNAPQRCVETHTCVVATIMKKRFSPETRQFVEQNYLPVTKGLRVAGAVLKPSEASPNRFDFEIAIPAFYKIIARDENVSGVLDGTPYTAARFLEPGRHSFESTSTSNKLVALWAQAADRHFTPIDNRVPVP